MGRGEELAQIDRRFQSERVLFLTGLGGMGKTELAVRYARDYVQAKGQQAYMVLFSGDFRQTMLNNVAPMISGLDSGNLSEQELYQKTLEALNSSGKDALLILDNADQANLTALRALFRLQDMKEEEKQALCYATLLPPEGMRNQLFRKALPDACRSCIERLQKRGWVQSENKLLTIHPVVRLVCRRELSPTAENCGDFLRWFRGQHDRTTYEREKFSQIAALYETASEVLQETDGVWIGKAGYLWLVLSESRRAEQCNERAVKLLEQNAPDSPRLATAYSNLGSTYGALGDREKELQYQLKALGILEQSLPPDHPNIVIFRSNIAVTYARMEDFIRANEYMRRALDSAERSMGNHPQLEMYRQAALILELCAMFQEAGMPLPIDNPFR